MEKEERKLKHVKFTVDLLFAESIDKKHLQEIAYKIADALRHEVDSGGLAPEDEDTFTEEIRVFNDESGMTTLRYESLKGWVETFVEI